MIISIFKFLSGGLFNILKFCASPWENNGVKLGNLFDVFEAYEQLAHYFSVSFILKSNKNLLFHSPWDKIPVEII